MASVGGSGSRSSNQNMSSFGQSVLKQQLPGLQNLWNSAANQQNVTGDYVNGLTPGAVNNQNGTANIAQGAMQNLNNGGAFADIGGGDVYNTLKGQLGSTSGLNGGYSDNGVLGSAGFMQGPSAIDPSAQRQLPGMIDSRQSNMLSRLNEAQNTTAGVGNFQQADVSNPFGNGPTATQQTYADIMGGKGNNYADALKNQMQTDANLAQNNMLNNLDQRVASNGMGGSSRLALAQAEGMKDINTNLQRDLTKVGYDTFDKDLTNKLTIAQQADANKLGAYKAGLDFNTSLVNAQNDATGLNQTYNTTLGGLANQNNQANQNYNLGYGTNVIGQNTANQNYNLGMNQNATGFNSNLVNAGVADNANRMGLTGAMANATVNNNANILSSNGGILSGLTGLLSGKQGSMNAGMTAAPGVQNMWGAPLQTAQSPWQSLASYADTLGGPIILGKGSSMGQGSSKGGGGGVSVGSMG